MPDIPIPYRDAIRAADVSCFKALACCQPTSTKPGSQFVDAKRNCRVDNGTVKTKAARRSDGRVIARCLKTHAVLTVSVCGVCFCPVIIDDHSYKGQRPEL